MATTRRWNRAILPCRERPWDGSARMSVLRPHPKTGMAEFDRVRGGLGHPRALGAQLQGKGVRGDDFRARASWSRHYFASTCL